MSLEKREQATLANENNPEEEADRLSGDSTADVKAGWPHAALTKVEENTMASMAKREDGTTVEATGADAMPRYVPETAESGSQLKLSDGRNQPNKDRSEVSSQVKIVTDDAVVTGSALIQYQEGLGQNKATTTNPPVSMQETHTATSFPAGVLHSPPRRSSSAPPTSTKRFVQQQRNYNLPRLDHVDKSLLTRWTGQPQMSAKAGDTPDPAKESPRETRYTGQNISTY